MNALMLKSFLLFLATTVVMSFDAGAEVFRFVDKDGIVHFSNVPNDSRYRPTAPVSPTRRRVNKRSRKTIKRLISVSYDPSIKEAARRFNIPVALIKAVITVESNFNPKAVSHAGAQGLMQLMPSTAVEMGVKDVFDPHQNILGGTRYLRKLTNSFDGNLVLTLASYNAGHRAVAKRMDIPPFAETQRYVRRVLHLYFQFKKGTRFQESDG
jgi:soluble lytic murein transglycosylase-like protein